MTYLHSQWNYDTCGPILLTISQSLTLCMLYNIGLCIKAKWGGYIFCDRIILKFVIRRNDSSLFCILWDDMHEIFQPCFFLAKWQIRVCYRSGPCTCLNDSKPKVSTFGGHSVVQMSIPNFQPCNTNFYLQGGPKKWHNFGSSYCCNRSR